MQIVEKQEKGLLRLRKVAKMPNSDKGERSDKTSSAPILFQIWLNLNYEE